MVASEAAEGLQIILGKLRAEVQKLLATPADQIPEATPLIQAQEMLEDLLPECREAEVKFFVFFLSNYLDDVFYNLTGDVPYSKDLDRERGEFFRKIAPRLLEMTEALEVKKYMRCHEICVDLVKVYLDTIEHLNAILC